uniref:NADH dehydrogenase subunit 6 n=1 Tax=Vespa orientalis TaxID=7447 RepID=A0A1S5YCH9_VESOR|nr:NADH dehydrogenase subunit 6 [Vespa orientalis]AQQ78861.1 NADH dehydrogenase subunit 6 [Vespa orientalis]
MLKSIILTLYISMLSILMYLILHPNLSMIQSMILLIFFTLSTCISISLFYTYSLYSLLIFLMIIGGLMILFMLFLSLISNQYMSSKKNMFLFSLWMSMILMLFIYKYTSFNMNLSWFNLSIQFLSSNYSFLNMNLLMEFPFNIYIIILMFFLLFSLILITKICISNSKPLRMIKK